MNKKQKKFCKMIVKSGYNLVGYKHLKGSHTRLFVKDNGMIRSITIGGLASQDGFKSAFADVKKLHIPEWNLGQAVPLDAKFIKW